MADRRIRPPPLRGEREMNDPDVSPQVFGITTTHKVVPLKLEIARIRSVKSNGQVMEKASAADQNHFLGNAMSAVVSLKRHW
jgi:hypothetical protein